MKKHEAPIPLRGIVCLPRWLMATGVSLSAACMLAGVWFLVAACVWAEGPDQLGSAIGAGLGCLGGGAGGMFGTLADWYRRLPAPVYLQHLRHDAPHPLYRRAFWPALLTLLACLALALVYGWWPWVWAPLQASAILAFVAGTVEATRRHATRRARAVFALYADGALDAEDTAAIDDARRRDERFDRDVREYLAIDGEVRALVSPSE